MENSKIPKIKSDTAILYCRVSTKEQAEEGYSLAAQAELLNSYAGARSLKIIKEFCVPESASGKQARKIFGMMIEYAAKKGVGNILCEKIDRMTRNQKEAISAGDWLDENEDRKIHFVKENFIAHKNTKAHENLVWDMKIAIARFYSNNLSEEVKKGQVQKIKEGWLPSRPPLGYKTVGEKGKKIHVINEEKAPYVKRMFELYASGQHSLKSLVDLLYREGLRNESGRKVLKSRMAELLADPFYYGVMQWKGVVYPAKHSPLISKELFNRVQELMHSKNTPKHRKHFHLFKQLIRCDACGSTVCGEIHKSRTYYRCNGYKGCRGLKFAREDRIEAQAKEIFDWFYQGLDPDEIALVQEILKENHQEEVAYFENAVENMDRQFQVLQQRKDRCYIDKLDGKISEDQYNRNLRSWDQEQERIMDEKSKLKQNNTHYLLLGSSFMELARKSKEIYESLKDDVPAKREFMSLIFSNLTLNGEILGKFYKKPILRIKERAEQAKSEKQTFEPQESGTPQRQNGDFVPVRPILLRG